MKIYNCTDQLFREYGQLLDGYDFSEMTEVMNTKTFKPMEGFVYKASEEELEKLPIFDELKNRSYGGMPIQIGYCNGTNDTLNCLEYHRDSEVCIAVDDIILLLGKQSQISDYRFDLSLVKAFLIPAGTGFELFATTLHYAPCSAKKEEGYRVVNVLPLGTNAEKPSGLKLFGEDLLCMGRNKWLLVHKDAPEVKDGAYIGLIGENIIINYEGF